MRPHPAKERHARVEQAAPWRMGGPLDLHCCEKHRRRQAQTWRYTQTRPHRMSRARPKFGRRRRELAKFGQLRPELGRNCPEVGRCRPRNSRRVRSKWLRSWSTPARLRPNSPQLRRFGPSLVKIRPEFGRCCPEVGRFLSYCANLLVCWGWEVWNCRFARASMAAEPVALLASMYDSDLGPVIKHDQCFVMTASLSRR